MTAMGQTAPEGALELTFTRDYAAPRERVFRAWTEPQHFARWFGPHDIAVPYCAIDARPGGALRFCHRSADGTELWIQGTFSEVVAPERLVFSAAFTDAHGRPATPAPVPDWPPEATIVTTVTLAAIPAGTRMTVHQAITPAAAAAQPAARRERTMARQGWEQTLERLATLMAQAGPLAVPDGSAGEVVLERVFDAPRELVYRAWAEPAHLARWFGPDVFTIPLCELDVRPGGALRIVMRSPDGTDFGMRGEYREVEPPARLAFTSTADDEHGQPVFETLTTVTLAAEGRRTRLTLRAQVLWAGDAAAPYLFGMEAGWSQSLAGLAAHLAQA